MKYLQDYMENRQTALFKETNTFFAFSQKQFSEGEKEGITYINMGSGMLCDKRYVEKLTKGLHKIYNDSIQQDIKENGIKNIIKRELANHEAWYTMDIKDTCDKLKDYPISKKQIKEIFIETDYDYTY